MVMEVAARSQIRFRWLVILLMFPSGFSILWPNLEFFFPF